MKNVKSGQKLLIENPIHLYHPAPHLCHPASPHLCHPERREGSTGCSLRHYSGRTIKMLFSILIIAPNIAKSFQLLQTNWELRNRYVIPT